MIYVAQSRVEKDLQLQTPLIISPKIRRSHYANMFFAAYNKRFTVAEWLTHSPATL